MASVSTVRDAVIADVPRIVEMGRNFRSQSSYGTQLAENPERMAQLAVQLIGVKGILLAERVGGLVGMLGFIIHSHFISGETVASEVFWWVEPEHRGDGLLLLKEMAQRAKAAGAKYIQMVAPNEKVAKLYRRMKYEFVESTYQAAL